MAIEVMFVLAFIVIVAIPLAILAYIIIWIATHPAAAAIEALTETERTEQ